MKLSLSVSSSVKIGFQCCDYQFTKFLFHFKSLLVISIITVIIEFHEFKMSFLKFTYLIAIKWPIILYNEKGNLLFILTTNITKRIMLFLLIIWMPTFWHMEGSMPHHIRFDYQESIKFWGWLLRMYLEKIESEVLKPLGQNMHIGMRHEKLMAKRKNSSWKGSIFRGWSFVNIYGRFYE